MLLRPVRHMAIPGISKNEYNAINRNTSRLKTRGFFVSLNSSACARAFRSRSQLRRKRESQRDVIGCETLRSRAFADCAQPRLPQATEWQGVRDKSKAYHRATT